MLIQSVLVSLFAVASAHVSMRSPCVRYTPFCETCPELPAGQSLDENINAPIGTHESISQPLCKYTTPYGTPAAHWTAGSTVTVDFHPHAAVHGGGHCQFALSYDGGNTFVVIHDELRYCFTGGPSSSNSGSKLEYQIALPSDLPPGNKVVFAWAWNNAIGNREFYMNCADVSIQGKPGGSYSGPQMLVANYGPATPFIPEFNGNYETGIELYNDRKMITITGSGSYSNSTAVPASGGNGASNSGGAGSSQPGNSGPAGVSTPSTPVTPGGSGAYGAGLPPIIGTAMPTPASSGSPTYAASSVPVVTPPPVFSTAPAGNNGGYNAVSSAPVYHARVAGIPSSAGNAYSAAPAPTRICKHVVKN
ncbi:hypothetical protein LPJ53_002406 [Coemansia erecta]|uniref:Chitin-binding type-4 domain-containing protein n=1 Tax=Coemansia erecta TaxID=147472 RepID=A0A9W7XY90_9FUNG|nr:hypothetical protein LPJ53_002406 [Coemansia erecta]